VKQRQGAQMLMITRRFEEAIQIGPDITIKVIGIDGRQVRLGIDAPKSVQVYREEIYQRIQQERSAKDRGNG
jgi:carbon storage regulator